MKSTIGIITTRIAACVQKAATLVDLEVLQRPGGSLIALLLLIRAMTMVTLNSRRP